MTDYDGIVPAIAEALRKRGYATLTPVQQAMIDTDLEGRDALVSAQTGSGKTVAFGLALAPTLLGGENRFGRAVKPLALCIAPTRELALQVQRELEWLYENTGAIFATCVGGMDIRNERRALERGAHIIVGTPGRLRDHITRRALDLSGLRAVVMDEADEMLDLGFREDLEFILKESPDERRTLMFSATVPRSIADLARSYQRDAKRIETVSEQKQHIDIEYRAMLTVPADKENAIINALRFYEARNAIVFCSTRANVNHLTARLHNRGFSVVALSGELSQSERTHALQAMRDGRARVCVATDVAARGIDLPGLELVIHADLPTNSETLLHRSGRTGRAGNKGVSALIVPMSQRRKAERILGGANVQAAWVKPPSADEVIARDDERLLADPVFSEAISEEEAATIARLLEAHGADKITAAYLRAYRSTRSAPEDLMEVKIQAERPRRENDTYEPNTPPRPRSEFGPSVWFSLSVGRRQSAEPRWLIPMLCRNGNITKNEIGAIKMQPEETFVEIAQANLEQFLTALGPNKTLERGIIVKQLPGMPDFNAPPKERAARPPRDDSDFAERKPRAPQGDKKPYAAKAEATERRPYKDDLAKADDDVWGNPKPASSFKKKSNAAGDSRSWDKPKADWAGKPRGDKPAYAGKSDKPAYAGKGEKPAYAGKPKGKFEGPAGGAKKSFKPKG
ncbi:MULTISPECIES: DEAD/DEAH box helicase [Rhizobium/Agrobacterium group]|uniref:DEAD/DEAH box helicase n=1 Tax=Rhizobium/Agrobacterium group TaxID=227290 RepID=UPI000B3FE3F0|nr:MULTISPECIES: DEAD/DEAH box helicase [Rhizobium/Agrobacterium group]MCF1484441.1 DEAD/DEAH box helicase [Allorhizobium ampelinum]NSZ43253.1 DEAD/DEAH box helicase [Agrobacterium vitis]NTA26910.1 DEAD/DEAH box helicase [Allorhizobium ampelinum]OVE94724.1 ATP-dependent RNA helicase [Allorhizobium ampelinum]